MRDLNQCTALLFDGSSAESMSRLFTCAIKAWHVASPTQATAAQARAQLQSALAELDVVARAGGHVVVALSYEAAQGCAVGEHLHLSMKPQAHPDVPPTPWLQAMQFDEPQHLDRAQALAWLKQQAEGATAQVTEPISRVTELEFCNSIDAIREWISAGDTYQVNYTFPLVADILAHSPQARPDAALARVYHAMVHDLRIPYGAFLTLQHSSVLSFSPELFVELKGLSLTCRPMKGTAAVGEAGPEGDNDSTRRAALLAADPKNRAENVMIVDLMRNDLSRLPQTLAVRVPKLFEVKRYGAVLQMTSTVRADVSTQPSLAELLDALFPCGSITGAPKRRTMEIIDALEPFTRGAYCGALGCLTPTTNGQFNATFSVPIRTLETRAEPVAMHGLGTQRWPVQCNVGAGITFGSVALDEWQESWLKAKFLTRHAPPFEIIETMCAERDETGVWRVRLLVRHAERMARSAAAFEVMFDAPEWLQAVEQALFEHRHLAVDRLRVRVGLQQSGALVVTIAAAEDTPQQARFAFHPQVMQSNNPFLQHKTSVRADYNAALAAARAHDLFDYVFVNELRHVTEGARSSIFIKLNDEWLTPPLSSGVLPGIARAELLADASLGARECTFSVDDVRAAERIILCNALHHADAEWVDSVFKPI
ncbi:Aminodeoxychorismate synthase component 1 [Ephemeroptericola cinctiostellae]|uniref:Aminodeoxychorismate synthase component 1 n=1 Tax=Ephemeroptericola cinctiostellae TaxID=2268024 RepID=A0A345D7W0_9BURK|nr:chorismate-binding protein [Ephemeroptericola cinctiostellae]AXF84448.1 Aminodeoxychorismate synthase component 1 [Ephemeroptericola cinctiostellae]